MYICDQNTSMADAYQQALYKIFQGGIKMSTTKYGFTKMTAAEFKTWINNQGSYNYTGIQIHHTWSPSYSNFYKSDGSHEDELTRQNNIKSYHMNTNGWGDIAQHFTIFPNGAIVTGRPLSNTTAIGIKGWNTNKICIEIYGNFDNGNDVMTAEQKNAVITVYGELCKKFNITPSVSTLRCHAWFTSGGTYLGDYVSGQSAKTCPGTNFMGFGNTKAAIQNNFIPLIQNYINSGSVDTPKQENYACGVYRVTTDTLNVRKGPGTSYDIVGKVTKGEVFTIVEVNGDWGYLKSGAGWIHLGYTEPVNTYACGVYRITADTLNIYSGPGSNNSVVGTVTKGEAFTIVEVNGNWGYLKSGAGWIHLGYAEKIG